MPRMYDVLRNKVLPQANSAEENKINNPSAEPPLSFPKGVIAIETKENKKQENYSLVSKKLISEVKKHGVDNQLRSEEVYKNAVDTVKILLEKVRIREDLGLHMDKVNILLDDIFNQIVLGDSILDNIYERQKEEYYLPYHIVNVFILSSVIGLNMGFNKSRLSHLGMAAIFCDMGLDSLREITSQPRALSEEERHLVKTHISKSIKISERIFINNEIVKEAILMHHERANGEGYPRGMGIGQINPYAKIIGLMDTYEAISNSRIYREKMNAHKAIKFIIGLLKDYFDADVMKVFINKMSIYPIGSIVRLDTQELARVISVRPGSPLRPVVMLIRDASGEPVAERAIIDLSRQDFPSIQDPL
jgi:HD-GYP domain-containing protein (c-di-GMP phosphodiesterase class II)